MEEVMENSETTLSRSVAAIVALVLGIIALIMSWMPIINNIAFLFGVPALICGIVGLVGVLRGKKSGKGLAIASVIISALAIIIVFATQSMYSAAFDKAVNGPQATSTVQQNTSTQSNGSQNEESASYTDLAVGTSVKLENGLSITVDSVDTTLTNYDGSSIVGAMVTYVNEGDENLNFNQFDWKGEDAQGAQEGVTFYSGEGEDLHSGTLTPGGSTSGMVYFKGGTVKVLYFPTVIAQEAAASWTVA